MPATFIFLLAGFLAPAVAAAPDALHVGVGRAVMVQSGDLGVPPDANDPAWKVADWRQLEFRDVTWLRAVVEVPEGFASGDRPPALS